MITSAGHPDPRFDDQLRLPVSDFTSRPAPPVVSFLAVLEIHLHFPENGSLKGKRKELQSVKAQLHQRFGAAVAETDHHDLWQRSTITASLVGRTTADVNACADRIERWLDGQFPQGVCVERGVLSIDEALH